MSAKRLLLVGLFLALVAATAACGMSVSTEDGELTITVAMSEDRVNGLMTGVIDSNTDDDFLLAEVTSVDLIEPNIIRVAGVTHDGAAGSYDMTIAAVDETIRLEVVAVDAPGVTLDDPRIQAVNDELAQAFLADASAESGGGGLSEVAVVDDELIFTIREPLE
jgi:hypothetical protein